LDKIVLVLVLEKLIRIEDEQEDEDDK
jgi:hypothetical protein